MIVILGFNAFHADSAACLVVDGVLQGAITEERLGERHKHTPAFPANAIRRLLDDAGLRLREVTHVAVARDPMANYVAKMAYVAARPFKAAKAVMEHFRRERKTKNTLEHLAAVCDEDPATVSFALVGIEHHLAHIASAYFLSPFEELTAGFSYDASGDFASMMAARCEGNRIEVIDRVTLPDSLGFFYTALCQFIGFDEFGEEYKVMSLASYGEDRYADLMGELVRLDHDGWYRLGRRYFGMHQGGESGALDTANQLIMGRLYNDRLSKVLGEPRSREAQLRNGTRTLPGPRKSVSRRLPCIVCDIFTAQCPPSAWRWLVGVP